MLRACLQRMSINKATLLVAFVFAFYHLDPLAFPEQFVFGIFVTYLAARTGTLVYSILFHFGNNLLYTGILEISQGQLYMPFPIRIEAVVGLILVILGAVLVRKVGLKSKESNEAVNPPTAPAPG
jgi:membrane protease YdiL (CAAX protease family)